MAVFSIIRQQYVLLFNSVYLKREEKCAENQQKARRHRCTQNCLK